MRSLHQQSVVTITTRGVSLPDTHREVVPRLPSDGHCLLLRSPLPSAAKKEQIVVLTAQIKSFRGCRLTCQHCPIECHCHLCAAFTRVPKGINLCGSDEHRAISFTAKAAYGRNRGPGVGGDRYSRIVRISSVTWPLLIRDSQLDLFGSLLIGSWVILQKFRILTSEIVSLDG